MYDGDALTVIMNSFRNFVKTLGSSPQVLPSEIN